MPIDDKEFIEDESKWPNWPFLPIKRPNPQEGLSICGTIVAGHQNRVIELNMFEFNDKAKVQSAPVHEYNSIDELLKDGWIVD